MVRLAGRSQLHSGQSRSSARPILSGPKLETPNLSRRAMTYMYCWYCLLELFAEFLTEEEAAVARRAAKDCECDWLGTPSPEGAAPQVRYQEGTPPQLEPPYRRRRLRLSDGR